MSLFDKSVKVDWWSKCGICGKKFHVKAPGKYGREEINAVFMQEHGVHLFPTRCKDCYVEPEEIDENTI